MDEQLQGWIKQIEDIDRILDKLVNNDNSMSVEIMSEIIGLRKTQDKMKMNFIYDYLLSVARKEI
jgi:hypothetical protein